MMSAEYIALSDVLESNSSLEEIIKVLWDLNNQIGFEQLNELIEKWTKQEFYKERVDIEFIFSEFYRVVTSFKEDFDSIRKELSYIFLMEDNEKFIGQLELINYKGHGHILAPFLPESEWYDLLFHIADLKFKDNLEKKRQVESGIKIRKIIRQYELNKITDVIYRDLRSLKNKKLEFLEEFFSNKYIHIKRHTVDTLYDDLDLYPDDFVNLFITNKNPKVLSLILDLIAEKSYLEVLDICQKLYQFPIYQKSIFIFIIEHYESLLKEYFKEKKLNLALIFEILNYVLQNFSIDQESQSNSQNIFNETKLVEFFCILFTDDFLLKIIDESKENKIIIDKIECFLKGLIKKVNQINHELLEQIKIFGNKKIIRGLEEIKNRFLGNKELFVGISTKIAYLEHTGTFKCISKETQEYIENHFEFKTIDQTDVINNLLYIFSNTKELLTSYDFYEETIKQSCNNAVIKVFNDFDAQIKIEKFNNEPLDEQRQTCIDCVALIWKPILQLKKELNTVIDEKKCRKFIPYFVIFLSKLKNININFPTYLDVEMNSLNYATVLPSVKNFYAHSDKFSKHQMMPIFLEPFWLLIEELQFLVEDAQLEKIMPIIINWTNKLNLPKHSCHLFLEINLEKNENELLKEVLRYHLKELLEKNNWLSLFNENSNISDLRQELLIPELCLKSIAGLLLKLNDSSHMQQNSSNINSALIELFNFSFKILERRFSSRQTLNL